jgi:hypothetical protein
MKNNTLIKTTWRIPADLYDELATISERDKISINTIGVSRLQAAATSDRFDKIDREMAVLKRMIAELLDKP